VNKCLLLWPELSLTAHSLESNKKENTLTKSCLAFPVNTLLSREGGGTWTKFLLGCSARGLDPLPFHILNFGQSGPFHILNFRKSGPFHILNFEIRHPFTYLFLKKVPLLHTSRLKKGPVSLRYLVLKYKSEGFY